MVYNYLLDLYQVLGERKMEIERLSKEPSDDSLENEQYRQGQLSALNDFTVFLKKNYHAKLPRRMQ
jgi:hypothetical protein